MFCISGTTVPLSRLLQTPSLDLKRATNALEDTLSVLEDKRKRADTVFEQLFYEAREIAEQLNVELRPKRLVSRQTQRNNNQPNQTAEEYFRKAIYIPLLDNVLSDLKDRLSPDVMRLFNLRVFLPRQTFTEEDLLAVRETAEFYKDL